MFEKKMILFVYAGSFQGSILAAIIIPVAE
jgi:hypothetical protein